MKKKKPKKLAWHERLRLYSEEKRRLDVVGKPFTQEMHLALVEKYKV